MELGFTLDEKILNKIEIEDLLKRAHKKGVSNIEVSPDEKLLSLESYHHIAHTAHSLNMDVHFHIPYFADPDLYETMNFSIHKEKILKRYGSFLSIVKDFQNILKNNPIIILHGANYNIQEKKKDGIHHTISFIDWMLNEMENNNTNGRLALETIHQTEYGKIGDTREDLFYILNEFQSENLGICWDLAHDTRNYYPQAPPFDPYFLDKIIYCHIHGVKMKEGLSHISLKESSLDFRPSLQKLLKHGFSGVLNIELLVSCCKENYLDDLFEDIKILSGLLYRDKQHRRQN